MAQRLDLVGESGHRLGAQHHLLEDRAAGLGGQLLGQVPDPEVLGAVDGAAVRLLAAHQHLDQRGLAGAVATDEGDPAARSEAEGDVLEEGAGPERAGKAGGGQHGGR